MRTLKILVVDPDILARQTIAQVLNEQQDVLIRVCAKFSEVERIIESDKPDVILLSIEQIHSDGFLAFNSLRIHFPDIPIVVLTPLTKKGALVAIQSLKRGAMDFITKPANMNILLFAENHFKKRILPLITEISESKNNKYQWFQRKSEAIRMKAANNKVANWATSRRFSVVVIGGCTGGPEALFKIFNHLTSRLSVPVIIAQHCPKIYTRELAKELHKNSDISVREAYNGTELEMGAGWLAPGGYHLEIQQEGNKSLLKTHRGERVNSVRPSIDVLFKSAARLYGKNVLGIVLSGSGRDGIEGAEIIRKNGGEILVQDPYSALIPSLPRAVLRKKISEYSMSADKIGSLLIEILKENDTGIIKGSQLQKRSKKYDGNGIFMNPL